MSRKMTSRLLLAAALLLVLLWAGFAAAETKDPDLWISPDGSLTPDAITYTKAENGKYYLMHNFTPNSSDFFLKMEIKFCPKCGRKLEE